MQYLNEIVMGSIIIFLGVLLVLQAVRNDKKERDLLNRIMAENHQEYVAGQTRLNKEPRSKEPGITKATDDQILTEMQSRGMIGDVLAVD